MAKALFSEDAESYRTKHARAKIEYDDNAELLAIEWRKLVSYARNDYESFINCIKTNEELFKHHTTESDREFLRGICNEARSNHFAESRPTDNDYFDSVFGYYIPSDVIMKGQQKAPRIQRELEYFAQMTYEGFWKWISNPDVRKRLKSNPNLKTRLSEIIENQKFENRCISKKHKSYDPKDEELFAEVLA